MTFIITAVHPGVHAPPISIPFTVTFAITLALPRSIISKSTGSLNRYVLSAPYSSLADQEQRVGNRYLVAEVDQFLMVIQGKSLRIGELEELLAGALNRNQIKYLISKLCEDNILDMQGIRRGTRYTLKALFSGLKGDVLVQKVLSHLREQLSHPE
jgi:hypothetical protein